MGEILLALLRLYFDWIFTILAGNEDNYITIKAWKRFNFGGIPPWTAELAALECVKNDV